MYLPYVFTIIQNVSSRNSMTIRKRQDLSWHSSYTFPIVNPNTFHCEANGPKQKYRQNQLRNLSIEAQHKP